MLFADGTRDRQAETAPFDAMGGGAAEEAVERPLAILFGET